jgi:hypothetical protein
MSITGAIATGVVLAILMALLIPGTVFNEFSRVRRLHILEFAGKIAPLPFCSAGAEN